jgi:predicted ATP-grasp superfamily ATP-dependent carboligase
MSTTDIISSSFAKEIVASVSGDIVVFKSSKLIEETCSKNGWKLLNPSAELAEKIESKVSQIDWLGDLAEKYLPQTDIKKASDIVWKEKPIVIQWEHGHTGLGTLSVISKVQLDDIQRKFPNRLARVSPFISGPSFTVNIVVGVDKIILGNMSYQITGLKPFTDGPFSTIGNDWSLPHSLLHEHEVAYIEKMIEEIAEKMRSSGWRGLFGMDLMKDDLRDTIHLIEINARQPASTTFESLLQQENRKHGVTGITIFEAHLECLKGDTVKEPLILVNDGAQVIQRVSKDTDIDAISEDMLGSLQLAGYKTIAYTNTEYNSDLLRIQSNMGIMEAHDKLNKRGKAIVEIISNRQQ